MFIALTIQEEEHFGKLPTLWQATNPKLWPSDEAVNQLCISRIAYCTFKRSVYKQQMTKILHSESV